MNIPVRVRRGRHQLERTEFDHVVTGGRRRRAGGGGWRHGGDVTRPTGAPGTCPRPPAHACVHPRMDRGRRGVVEVWRNSAGRREAGTTAGRRVAMSGYEGRLGGQKGRLVLGGAVGVGVGRGNAATLGHRAARIAAAPLNI